MEWGFRWRPYVPVAKRRAAAERFAKNLEKKSGKALEPITINGRTIAATFWGKAWCENLESYSDFANRLPRGRTYVRNGSVIDLKIEAGNVAALVSGSSIYTVQITIAKLKPKLWEKICDDCAQSIDSLIDLMQGRFSKGVMQRLTRPEDGLFPKPSEIKMKCSCPDWAVMCKHVAAVLYGAGARLDHQPDLLFKLRDVDHLELVSQAMNEANIGSAIQGAASPSLGDANLEELFGIDLGGAAPSDTKLAKKGTRKKGERLPSRATKKVAKKTVKRIDGPQAGPKSRGTKKATPRKKTK